MKDKYNPKTIEKEIANIWNTKNLYKTLELESKDKKYYSLYSFPYPSGSGLHVGHAEGMVANDIMARYFRMNGYKVLFPMGWDAFGLPAENFAIKTGTPPLVSTENAIKNFKEQINRLGISVDWDKEIGTHRPDYYKWTQWIFLELFKRGKAYKKNAPVNWCPNCQTVLANEQVVEGTCERCETKVVQKNMDQWFFKITDYADRLDKDLEDLDWPNGTKQQQKNWIGKSEGSIVKFLVQITNHVDNYSDVELSFDIFTTRLDTIYGATFCVLSPEHPLIEELQKYVVNRQEVQEYIAEAKDKTDLERQTQKEKKGVRLEGVIAINPFNNDGVPIYVADYVLSTYGTGAIMAVPAHDERDYEFAKKYNIPVKTVIEPVSKNETNVNADIFTQFGKLISSGSYTGLDSQNAITKMQEWLVKNNLGCKKITYKLRDWLVSRQRYWGAPIPIIYSPKAKDEGYGYLPKEKLNILVLHGLGSYGYKGWRAELAQEMNKLGHKVYLPDLPNSSAPDIDEWINFIEQNYKFVFDKSDKLVIVGHSLGGLTALKLAERYKIAKIIAVAPAAPMLEHDLETKFKDASLDQIKAWKSIVQKTQNIKISDISKNVDEIIVINSKDDQIVGADMQNYWRERLQNKALFIDFEDKGHFNSDSLKDGFPEIFPYINLKNNSDYPGIFPVCEKDLPVLLPEDVDFKPTGESPIKYSKTFNKGVKCPIFGTEAYRESDTMDTFVDSSWYFLRYVDSHNNNFAFPMSSLLPIIHSENNNILLELMKEIAEFCQNLNYCFTGLSAISILNNGPFRDSIDSVDVKIKNSDFNVFMRFLESNNFVQQSHVRDTITFISEKYKYTLKVTLEENCEFTKKYLESQLYKIDKIDNLKNFTQSFNHTDIYTMLDSFDNSTNNWLPADIYMIGAEHTVLHLLYSRFFTKFFYDCGYINFDEPFKKMRHMGLILGPDGRKMSKRWGNVINPIDEIEKYSADTVRMYEMFMGPYEEAKPWNDRAEKGVFRFINRIFELANKVSDDHQLDQKIELNLLIPKISIDIESLSYNTAIAKFMEFSNYLGDFDVIDRSVWEGFLKLMAPFAPFVTEYLWRRLSHNDSIHEQQWPKYDPELSKNQVKYKVAVQINGKIRGTLTLDDADTTKEDLLNLVKQDSYMSKFLNGEVKKLIYVPNKIFSIVIAS